MKRPPIAVIVLAGVLGLSGFVSCIFVGISMITKQGDEYQEAIRLLREHPKVQSDLGEPIDEGFFVGSTSNQKRGEAARTLEDSVTLSGPKGEGEARITVRSIRGYGKLVQVAWEHEGERVVVFDATDSPTGTASPP